MNPNLTEITYILDRSGSMQPMQEAGVAAFNNFIRGQLDVPGDANVTLVQFDDAYEVPVAVRPIHEVPELTAADYVPRGSTASWSAGGPIQGPLHVLHDLIREHDLKAEDVERLVAWLPDVEFEGVNNRGTPDNCVQHLLAVMLAALHGLSASTAGLIAIPGAAGVLFARPIGKWVDASGPRPAVTMGVALVIGAWAVLGLAGLTVEIGRAHV